MEHPLGIPDAEMTDREVERWTQRCIRALILSVIKRGVDSHEINVDDVIFNGIEMGDWSIIVEKKNRKQLN